MDTNLKLESTIWHCTYSRQNVENISPLCVFFRRGRKPKRRRHTSDLEKGHHCTSACRGRHALSDDEDFIVHDTDEDSEGGDSGRVRGTCLLGWALHFHATLRIWMNYCS